MLGDGVSFIYYHVEHGETMEGTLKERLFREPGEDGTGILFLGTDSFLFAVFVYYRIRHDHTAVSSLFVGSIFLFNGLPELLPSNKRRLAGIGRLFAICYALFVVGYFLFWY